MFSMYRVSIDKGESRFLLSAPQEYDFSGFHKRFQLISITEKHLGQQFLVLQDGKPHELWVVWDKGQLLRPSAATRLLNLFDESPNAETIWVKFYGGMDAVKATLANAQPGFMGTRLLTIERPEVEAYVANSLRRIEFDDTRELAVFQPDSYFGPKYPRRGKIHRKEIRVDDSTYNLEHVLHGFHIYDPAAADVAKAWRGSFQFDPGSGKFRIVEVADPKNKWYGKATPKVPFADSQKGAVRAILTQYSS